MNLPTDLSGKMLGMPFQKFTNVSNDRLLARAARYRAATAREYPMARRATKADEDTRLWGGQSWPPPPFQAARRLKAGGGEIPRPTRCLQGSGVLSFRHAV